MPAPIDPDCRDGKHHACIGITWADTDDPKPAEVDCACYCHLIDGNTQ